jgi:hypothetical protein
VGAGSVEVDSVGVDDAGSGSVDVGWGVGVEVMVPAGSESGSGWDVIVDRTAPSIREEAVAVKLRPAYRSRLSCNSRRIRMIVRITATISLKRS